MKSYLELGILFCIVINAIPSLGHPTTTTAATVISTYDNKFDNVDLDEILQQERLLKNYINCLESKGPCTTDGKMLKDTMPDAIETNCSKCTERQKYGSEKVTRFLIDNRPEDWERLEKIYDPQGTYRAAYLDSKTEKDSQVVADTKEANN